MTVWLKERFEDRRKDFEKVVDKLTVSFKGDPTYQKNWDEQYKQLRDKYMHLSLVNLESSVWIRIEESDSIDSDTIKYIKSRMREANDTNDIYKLIEQAVTKAPAPIILKEGHTFTVICGEPMLMVCTLLDIKPKVIIIPR